jgi:hypothetical protein
MSVEDLQVIDFVSIDLNGNAVLTISDHLEWKEDNEHLLILQNKINAYLAAVENGDLYDNYPNAKDRKIVIDISLKYALNNDGETIMERIKEALKNAGYGFYYTVIS